MKPSRFEINYSIELLEREGYLVRRPSESSLPVTLEVLPHQRSAWEVNVRADTTINGETCCLGMSFPADRLLDPDDDTFRKNALPNIMSRELGRFIADKLAASLGEQVETKINPLVPEKRMSLFEIENYLAWALRDCRAEKEGTNTSPVR